MHFELWTFIFTVINLIVVIAVLNKILYKPLVQMMNQREQQVENSLTKAAKDREEAGALLAQYQAQITQAKDDAQQIIDKAAKTGEKVKEDIIVRANEEGMRLLEKAKGDIHLEKEKALSHIRDEAATLAILAASKVVGRAISKDDHERMLKEFMEQVGDVQ